MPYTEQQYRDAVIRNIYAVQNPGDLNYLITMNLLLWWKKVPCYDTIHCFRRDFVVDPKHNEFLQDLRKRFADRFTTADIYAAAAEAYCEFRLRVGKAYEKKKRELNGDIIEYVEALEDIKALKADEKPVEAKEGVA